MAYRDLTDRFIERRANLRKRNMRFQMQTYISRSVLGVLKQRNKSHAMEKALLQDACEVWEKKNAVHRPKWTHFSDSADECIRLLHAKLDYLQLLHTRRLMIRFDNLEEQQEDEINCLTEEITALFYKADRSLKGITSTLDVGRPSFSQADRRVRLNSQRAIAGRLQGISTQFRARQREYLQRLQLQKFGSEIFDVDSMEKGTTLISESSRLDIKATAIAIDRTEYDIRTRDIEIQRIARSVATLATIFKEVADIVVSQGTLVDRIDYNMEQVVEKVRSGIGQLHRVDKHQRNTRPERCIYVLLTLIWLCCLILIMKHS
ncbi:syntaxin-like protein [Plasmopara halstedii]|uniref:Syntaxin-like protein n=1 Tax=Plasmopara halstedii TaxID=4781 RepID=A0A0P1AYM0_PLAHL|nr:syntaxin-like protein [Plasmopara halstedii]CEG46834.1 syntaxin-like protein [Plasmopara halstedii]|eukprot:XP_024583203.1 syntaxin-like protein [Plasmopara halstedii]